MDFLAEAGLLREEIVGYRRYIHRHPELGMETAGTADFVQASLEKMGIRCFRPIPHSVCGIPRFPHYSACTATREGKWERSPLAMDRPTPHRRPSILRLSGK